MKTNSDKSIKQSHVADGAMGQSVREACINIADSDEPLLFIEGHDNAIIGVTERGGVALIVYDSEKILRRLRKRDGMSKDDAEEFFAYNIYGAWRGEQTPIFVAKIR
ncbi:hypothetical protein DBR47_12365 [Paucibacter sp. KBW04]|uniref:hypothetical protein n=1 Tax=Paucibacter sp. KBW04 TaxID=2153361 RepID=UPI000F55A521|nr:hypothetical protein [Paucibacter sp. KBW04]RQO58499.1 hypothetical protein DBR47_12365 [Paucibacter sp. KBW04]